VAEAAAALTGRGGRHPVRLRPRLADHGLEWLSTAVAAMAMLAVTSCSGYGGRLREHERGGPAK